LHRLSSASASLGSESPRSCVSAVCDWQKRITSSASPSTFRSASSSSARPSPMLMFRTLCT
jgi:hypothetical protein